VSQRRHQFDPRGASQIDRAHQFSSEGSRKADLSHAASTGRALFVASTREARSYGVASDLPCVEGESGRAQQRGLYRVHSTTDVGVGNMSTSISAARPFRNGGDRQRSSSTDNHSQPPQRDFGGVAEMPEPVLVDMALIKMCRDELDAVNLCIDMSRMSDEALCLKLGVDKGHWSRIRKGRAHFPTSKRLELMVLAGNWAPIQYELFRTPVVRLLREKWEAELRTSKATDESVGQRWYA
jgi:hypothetical protein